MSEKGSVGFRPTKRGGHYFVSWYEGKKQHKITRYKGIICDSRRMATSLMDIMRSDEENGTFNIDKYLYQITDVIPYLEGWVVNQTHLAPATLVSYKIAIRKHLKPWFIKNPISLHEIQYDVLCRMLNELGGGGKCRHKVLYTLHAALKDAKRSGKIIVMPEFPQQKKYGIEPKQIVAVSEARQIAIINAIPVEHQPIFWWLKYHYRRPSEACALYKEDYDKERDCFIIRRGFSDNQFVEHTKTHMIHETPCHPDFRPWLDRLHLCISPYFFTREKGRLEGKRYHYDFLFDTWNKAAAACGETIGLYAGVKHSSCTAFVNEHGGSIDELQMLTDHSKRESVLKYTDVKLEAKRRIQGRVLRMKEAVNNG